MNKHKASEIHPASFRDNDGFVFESQGKLLRQVNQSYKEDYDFLISSGLYQVLVDQKLLIPHQEVSLNYALSKDAYKVLAPLKVEFLSYPYEWCFSQLKEAALITLKIQNIALEHGMVLKDASSFNIQFVSGKPIFIDTLSFEKFKNQPWLAYRQFCQHFLNPLFLMSKIDPGLNKLLSIYLDGITAELTSKMLPFWSKFNPTVFIHIQLPTRVKGKAKPRQVSFSKNSLKGLISSLESTIIGCKLPLMKSFWSSYVPAHDSYTKSAFKDKEKIIADYFKQTETKRVWDLGSNTGHFSRLIARPDVEVISFDYDPLSVEKNYQLSKDHNNVLPLVVDWTNPSPSLGWADTERESIVKRGPTDCILALALIHHLCIGANIPLNRVAKLFSALTQSLIIEFVPKEDSQIKEMLLLRKDIFTDYNQPDFEKSFGKYFKIIRSRKVKDSLRWLYLMKAYD